MATRDTLQDAQELLSKLQTQYPHARVEIVALEIDATKWNARHTIYSVDTWVRCDVCKKEWNSLAPSEGRTCSDCKKREHADWLKSCDDEQYDADAKHAALAKYEGE